MIKDCKVCRSAISKHLFARKDLLETTICLSNIATLKNGYAFQSGKYNALGKWKILTITNVSGERYINDEDYNCIINLPNDIQDHQVLKEGDILISLTGTLSKILCKWKQDSVVSLFLYLNSVFKHKHKLIHNQAPV